MTVSHATRPPSRADDRFVRSVRTQIDDAASEDGGSLMEKVEAVSEGSVMRMEGVVEKASLMKVAFSRVRMESW